MDRRVKQKSFGGGSAAIGALWTSYSFVTTAKELPTDTGWFAKMLVEQPVYLPWLLTAVGIFILIWAFWWPSDESDIGGSDGLS